MGRGHDLSIATTIDDLRQKGIEIWFEADRLRFRAPKGALSPEDRAWLSQNRDGVLAALIDDARRSGQSHPVSFGQKALWFIQQQVPESSAYHVSVPARITGPVVPSALRRAVQALVDRHPSLRTTYAFENGELLQVAAGWAAGAFEAQPTGSLAEPDLRQLAEDDAAEPFELATGPLLRVRLYTRAPDDHVLVMTAHHIAADGWSLLTLFDEFTRLYQEFTGGVPAALGTPRSDYIAYTKWQQGLLDGPEGERLWTYWRDRMAPPYEPMKLPVDRPSPLTPSFRGSMVPIPLSRELTHRVRDLGTRFGVTPFVIWLATFKAFLSHLTGARDLIVGTPTFGRSLAEYLPVVGNFVNSVPLRSRIDPDTTLTGLAGALRNTLIEAVDAQELPFSRLVQLLHPGRGGGETPLFNVFFALQRFDQYKHIQTLLGGSPDAPPVAVGGLKLSPFPIRQRGAQFDLSLQMVEVEEGITAVFWYSVDVFDAATVERLAQGYAAFVGELVEHPERPLGSRIPLAVQDATLAALLARLANADVRLSVVDGKLKLNAPKGALDETLRAEIVARRDALIAYLAQGTDPQDKALSRIPRKGTVPLSAIQRRIWFAARMHPESNQYNVGGGLRLLGPINVETIRCALGQIIRRHESLRMTIGERDGEPDAQIWPAEDASPPPLPVTPVSSDDAAKAMAEDLLREPFELAKGPLARFHLLSLAAEEHVFVVCLHHVIADGWSLSILLEDLCEIL